MLQQFLRFIEKEALLKKGDKLLLAVSGGKDSMAMAELFRESKIPFGIAHMNFGLRGEESDGDEAFVKAFAEQLNCPFFGKRVNTYREMELSGESLQMTARRLRYAWFEEIRAEQGYTGIAVAHHQQDSVETVLINMVRGSGIGGMVGILPKQGKIIRPLLCFTGQEIAAFVEQNKMAYREDSSNASKAYWRNRLRQEVVPVLKELNPSIEKTVQDMSLRMQELAKIEEEYFTVKYKELVRKDGDRLCLLIDALRNLSAVQTFLYHLLEPLGFQRSQLTQVLALMDAQTGKQLQAEQYRIFRDREELVIVRIEEQLGPLPFSLSDDRIFFGEQEIEIAVKAVEAVQVSTDPQEAFLDADLLKGDLLLRPWGAGDRLVPLGMNQEKKVSDMLTDAKVSAADRATQAVLLCGTEVVWLLGLRISDRYRIGPKTKKVVHLRLKK